MLHNEDTGFSNQHFNMSELLTLDGRRFNGGKRNLGQFTDNAVAATN
jgi:hypothetical protein